MNTKLTIISTEEAMDLMKKSLAHIKPIHRVSSTTMYGGFYRLDKTETRRLEEKGLLGFDIKNKQYFTYK